MHVDVGVADEIFREPKLLGARAHKRERCCGGFLQDVAHVTSEVELARAGHPGGFDEEQIASGRGPCQARRHSRPRASLRLLPPGFRGAQHAFDERRVGHDRNVLAGREPHGDGATYGRGLLLELPDARFVRVRVDHHVDGLIGEV